MRLIDADKLSRKLRKWQNRLIATYGINDEYVKCLGVVLDNIVKDNIEDAPTIEPDWNEMLVLCDNCGHAIHVKRTDVKPIIEPNKGHWVSDEDGNIKCSECGRLGVGDNYCEHCGADMREETDDAGKNI